MTENDKKGHGGGGNGVRRVSLYLTDTDMDRISEVQGLSLMNGSRRFCNLQLVIRAGIDRVYSEVVGGKKETK